jgi:uncharacterized protein
MSARIAVSMLLLTACARSPRPTFYTLSAHEGEARADVAGVIEVRTPHLAGYLDRHELVLGIEDQRLQLAGEAHWAEPLAAMLARVLARDLAQRLPQAQVFTDDGGMRLEPAVRVELDVSRFERDGEGQLRLDVLIAVRRTAEPAAVSVQSITLRARPPSARPADLVKTMSALLAELADRLVPTTAALLAQPPR